MTRPLYILATALLIAQPFGYAAAAEKLSADPDVVVADDGRCVVPYTLRPHERRVVTCQIKPQRWLPLVQAQSRHRSVDAVLLQTEPLAVSVALNNRADAPVRAVAYIDVF